MIRELIKKALRKAGYIASRYDPRRDPDVVRNRFFELNSINTVLDVGANAGQYGAQLRRLGYRGKIVSFEPLSSAFAKLTEHAADDANWLAERCALGDYDGTSSINIAGNSWSSSLLEMLPRHVYAAPQSAYIGKEAVVIQKLDSVFDLHVSPNDYVFLKIDTQGFTSKILAGAAHSLKRVKGLEVELSTAPLYEGEPLIHEVLSCLYEKGFAVYYLESELIDDNSGQQLQLNGLFHRRE